MLESVHNGELKADLLEVLQSGEPVHRYHAQDTVYDLAVPLETTSPEGRRVRWAAVLQFDGRGVQQALARNVWGLFVLQLGLYALVVLVFVFILNHYVLGPLDRLRLAIHDYADGYPDASVPVERADEIGVLARSLDNLIRALEAAHALRPRDCGEGTNRRHDRRWRGPHR